MVRMTRLMVCCPTVNAHPIITAVKSLRLGALKHFRKEISSIVNGKRSPRSLNECGPRESAAICDDGFEKKLERIASLKDAGSLGSQQSGGKELTVVGLIAEADFSPLDGRTSSPFRGVVGRLNPFIFEKGE